MKFTADRAIFPESVTASDSQSRERVPHPARELLILGYLLAFLNSIFLITSW
jgi:hypothetical protein